MYSVSSVSCGLRYWFFKCSRDQVYEPFKDSPFVNLFTIWNWSELKLLVPLYSVTARLPYWGNGVSSRRRWIVLAAQVPPSGIKTALPMVRNGLGTVAFRYELAAVMSATMVAGFMFAGSIRHGFPLSKRRHSRGIALSSRFTSRFDPRE